MKTKRFLFILMVVFGYLNCVLGQYDPQWYVRDGRGWNGERWNDSMLETGNIKIFGFQKPNIECRLDANDDIFIIFNDGTYYSSRPNRIYHPNLHESFIYNNNDLSFNVSKPILYLYSTNIYDDDPPPSRVSVTSENNTKDNIIKNTGSNFAVSANHNVRPGSDITLILNNSIVGKINDSSMINTDTLIIKSGNVTSFMVNNQVQNVIVSNVFSGMNILNGPNDIFVNYKARNELRNILNTIPDSDTLYLRFSIKSSNGYFFLDEQVTKVHDPNFINPYKICSYCDKSYVLYHGSFYNSTTTPANKLAFEFDLPDFLDSSTIKFEKIEVAQTILTDNQYKLNISGRKCSVVLDSNFSITNCKNGNPQRVNFLFRVQLNDDSNVNLQNVDLTLTNAFTTFGHPDGPKYKLEYFDTSRIIIPKQSSSIEIHNRNIYDDCSEIKEICLMWPNWTWIFLLVAALLAILVYKKGIDRKKKR